MQGIGDAFAGGEPGTGTAERDENNGDEVIFANGMGRGRGGVRAGIFLDGGKELLEERARVGVLGDEAERFGGAVFSSGRDALSGEEEDGFGFTVDPVELEAGGAGLEAGFDGDHGPGGDLEEIAGIDTGKGDTFAIARGIDAKGGGHVALARPELTTVAVEEAEVDVAP